MILPPFEPALEFMYSVDVPVVVPVIHILPFIPSVADGVDEAIPTRPSAFTVKRDDVAPAFDEVVAMLKSWF